MRKKFYTFMFIPQAKGKFKKFTFSSKFLKVILSFLSIVFIFISYIIVDWTLVRFEKREIQKLRNENLTQKKTISELGSTIELLNKEIKFFKTYAEKLNGIAGLESPYALREVGGIGGGGYDSGKSPKTSVEETAQTQSIILEKAISLKDQAMQIEGNLKLLYKYFKDQALLLASTPSIWPTRGYITAVFGMRTDPFTGKRDFHPGIDISTQIGNNVIAPADGLVLVSEYRLGYGNIIILDHGFGYTTIYAHLSKSIVKEGKRVKRYDVIGYVGSTGKSTGAHLHYEVRKHNKPQNPINFILEDIWID
ncbi:MAG: M23 family metallopeptidase [Acidobacteriota bacterium]